jgi:hypothetical protein
MRHVVLWLIHGTIFDKRPRWTAADSPFRNELAASLRIECEYRAFEWSGGNSHAARIAGGREFASVLRHAIDDDPVAAHYVIAHSHGGNVVMYALREFGGVPRQLIGVATLGTPFIRILRRPVPRRVRLVSTVVALAVTIGLARSVRPLLRPIDRALAELIRGPVSALLMLIGVAAVMVGALYLVARWIEARFGPWLVRRAYRLQSAAVRRLRFGRYRDLHILCVQTRGDEARFGIAAGRALGEGGHLPWHRVTTKPAFAIWLIDWAAVTVWVGIRLLESHLQWRIPLGKVLIAMAWPAVFIVGGMLVSVIWAPLWGLFRWPTFGWDDVIPSWFADVRVTRTPWPDCDATVVVSDTRAIRRTHWRTIGRAYGVRGLLAHALLYCDPVVMAGIALHVRKALPPASRSEGSDA